MSAPLSPPVFLYSVSANLIAAELPVKLTTVALFPTVTFAVVPLPTPTPFVKTIRSSALTVEPVTNMVSFPSLIPEVFVAAYIAARSDALPSKLRTAVFKVTVPVVAWIAFNKLAAPISVAPVVGLEESVFTVKANLWPLY